MEIDREDHVPGSFDDVDLEAGYTNGDSSPVPPPHQTPPPPLPKPSYDPEECKALGNKYFKAKDYTKAITEYTKGMSQNPPDHTDHNPKTAFNIPY